MARSLEEHVDPVCSNNNRITISLVAHISHKYLFVAGHHSNQVNETDGSRYTVS